MMLDELDDEDYCYLVTTGRRTGNPHEIEIWFGASGNSLYLLSGGGERADWVANLQADPAVRVTVGERTWQARARVVTDEAEESLVRRLLAEKYQSWRAGEPLSDWAATALPVAVDLAGG